MASYFWRKILLELISIETIVLSTKISSGIISSKIIIFDRIFDGLIPDRYIFDWISDEIRLASTKYSVRNKSSCFCSVSAYVDLVMFYTSKLGVPNYLVQACLSCRELGTWKEKLGDFLSLDKLNGIWIWIRLLLNGVVDAQFGSATN